MTSVDLPSLLATTAARQAITPTARMQARLATLQTMHSAAIPDAKGTHPSSIDPENSQSFNHLARKILAERAPRKAAR